MGRGGALESRRCGGRPCRCRPESTPARYGCPARLYQPEQSSSTARLLCPAGRTSSPDRVETPEVRGALTPRRLVSDRNRRRGQDTASGPRGCRDGRWVGAPVAPRLSMPATPGSSRAPARLTEPLGRSLTDTRLRLIRDHTSGRVRVGSAHVLGASDLSAAIARCGIGGAVGVRGEAVLPRAPLAVAARPGIDMARQCGQGRRGSRMQHPTPSHPSESATDRPAVGRCVRGGDSGRRCGRPSRPVSV